MNSSPLIIPRSSTTTYSGNVGSVPFNGTATTSAPPLVLPPSSPQARYIERTPNTIAIEIDRLPAAFIAEGVKVKVIAADAGSVKYVIEQQ